MKRKKDGRLDAKACTLDDKQLFIKSDISPGEIFDYTIIAWTFD